MKIGIVLYPTFGGSGVVATELGKALAAKGHEIHFITYSQPVRLGRVRKNIFYHEVSITDYPLFDYAPYELVLTSKLVDVVRFEKLDLLHVHYAIPHASAAYMAKQILADHGVHIPFITTLHGTDITLVGRDSSFEPVITFAINHSDAVTAVSQSLKEDTYEHFGVTRDIHVIPNFIDTAYYKSLGNKIDRSLYAPNGELIISHVSNFRKVKRVQDVVKVFDGIRKEKKSKLLLIGDGPERHHIETMCRNLNICDDLIMLGKLEKPEEALSFSDLFLLTSEFESFGLAALEAMACGVPVVSTNKGGLPEVNIQGYSGYLCDVGDIEGMVSKSLEILHDKKSLGKFRENAVSQAKNFDILKILPMYEKLYESLSVPISAR